ncbi:hypothetical protein [Sorangium sp. So ce693]|uniref:hypothetical protein n=1 Tax=Sorangium sp. So ce693 TaxID=3133318 RepID=UPI003F5FE909
MKRESAGRLPHSARRAADAGVVREATPGLGESLTGAVSGQGGGGSRARLPEPGPCRLWRDTRHRPNLLDGAPFRSGHEQELLHGGELAEGRDLRPALEPDVGARRRLGEVVGEQLDAAAS